MPKAARDPADRRCRQYRRLLLSVTEWWLGGGLEGGGLFEFKNPPPPSLPPSPPRPPKVFELIFLHIEILGESVGTAGAIFFFWPPDGVLFCFTLRVYTQNTQNLVENSQMGEKHKKIDP